jgi:hypothetical protein
MYNPVDYKIEDVIVVHAGTYVGAVLGGKALKINETDLPAIKGGMVAFFSADNEFGISNGSATEHPVGIFYGDGSRPRDLSVLMRGGLYEILNNWDTSVALNTYVVGTQLIANANGKLTPKGASTNPTVAIITKAPASVTDSLGIKLVV